MRKLFISLTFLFCAISMMAQVQIDTLHLVNCTFIQGPAPYLPSERDFFGDPDIIIERNYDKDYIEITIYNNNVNIHPTCNECRSHNYRWNNTRLYGVEYDNYIEYRIESSGYILTRIKDYGTESIIYITRKRIKNPDY